MDHESIDTLVIGAGFGGLSAALHLVAEGRQVVLCETLAYPGGCASTFERQGARYEAGATMFAGFGPSGWMRHLVDHHRLDVAYDLLDPVAGFRAPGVDWTLPRDREAFVEQMALLAGARAPGVRRFFQEVEETADTLWSLFDAPGLLPPFDLRALASHARRLPRYVPLLRGVGRPLSHRLRAHGLGAFAPLRLWLDAVCQITVQTAADEAEAPVAMAAIDYFWRGTAHVHGGIGALAAAFVDGIRARGGRVSLTDRVKRLERVGSRWHVETRRHRFAAERLVANLLPQDVDRLRGIERTDRRIEAVRAGWGAAMLYLQVDDALGPEPVHLQLVLDPGRPLTEGNLVLLSVGERRTGAPRTATVSTHLPLGPHLPERVAAVQQRMRENLRKSVPELGVLAEMTASPRTFARFTSREHGLVGGIPRRAGLRSYLDLWPVEHAPGLWLVGDSTFPGQSVLAVSIGGHRVAAAVRRSR